NYLLHRILNRLKGLIRKTVDKVKTYGRVAYFAALAHHTLQITEGLNPVDGLLYLQIEVLHTEAHAAKAKIIKRPKLIGGCVIWMTFETKLMFGVYAASRQESVDKVS